MGYKMNGGTGTDEWRPRRPEDGEPDPEKQWKERKWDWNEEGGRRTNRFVSGFIRRIIISAILFGAVWGVFAIDRPWAYQAQNIIADSLSRDMDFAAVRTWYDRYFDGAPAFIPLFGDGEESVRKVAALHKLSPPVNGTIVEPFASTLKGIEISPLADETGSVTIKSVDMGRVLSVSKETGGGIRVTVQHSGGITAEYGHLSGTKLKADEWLESGETVGWMAETAGSPAHLLYFAVMKDKAYIDPAEEIGFD